MTRRLLDSMPLSLHRDVRVRDAMTANPVTARRDTNLADAVELMNTRNIRHLPIVENGVLIGLLSERHVRDALPSVLTLHDPAARRRFLSATHVHQVWIAHPETILPDATILEAITLMRRLRAGSLPVTLGDHRLVGILTSGDLVNLLERFLHQA